MPRNTAFGKWTKNETNWSKDDEEFIKKAIHEPSISISYEELITEHEAKLLL